MRIFRRRPAFAVAVLICVVSVVAACAPAEEEPAADAGAGATDGGAEATETADAGAEGYPEGGTSWIIPFAPGGGADASFRVFMKYADPLTDASMSVVNIEGAGGVTGWSQFIDSDPDGYTLSLATPPFNLIPKILQPDETPYELEEFQYMCVFAVSPNALLVRENDDRFETLEDVIEAARENPEGVIAVGDGAASPDAIHRFQLEGAADVKFTYVPGDSAGNAQQLAAGDVDVMFSDTSWVELQAGQLRAVAVASEERHPNHPDVPTYTELGYDVVGARLRAPAAPPGTPEHVIEHWQDVCEQVTQDEAFVDEMAEIGQPVQFMDPDEATEFVGRMVEDMQAIVDEHGLQSEG